MQGTCSWVSALVLVKGNVADISHCVSVCENSHIMCLAGQCMVASISEQCLWWGYVTYFHSHIRDKHICFYGQ